LLGKELGEALADSALANSDIVLLDAEDAAGRLSSSGEEVSFIQKLDADAMSGLDIVFFAGDAQTTRTYSTVARQANSSVIDLTYALETEPETILRGLWGGLLPQTVQPDLTAEEKRQLPPPLGKLLAGDLGAEAARCAALGAVGNPQASMMTRLDRFYLDQRVRLFIGNGLTLYGLTTDWRTPFLSIPWVAATGLLPRAWKLGSNWHRHAINRLCPALLDFPEERLGPRMAARAPAFYWHRRRRTQPVVPYVDYRKLIATPAILDLLADHAGAIDDLLPRPAITALIDGVRAGKRGQRSFSILTSLALWRWQMRNR